MEMWSGTTVEEPDTAPPTAMRTKKMLAVLSYWPGTTVAGLPSAVELVSPVRDVGRLLEVLHRFVSTKYLVFCTKLDDDMAKL